MYYRASGKRRLELTSSEQRLARPSPDLTLPPPSDAEMRDSHTGLPNYRALRHFAGPLFGWTNEKQVSDLRGSVSLIVFDLIGGTHTSHVTNSAAGFDIVRTTLKGLASAIDKIGSPLNESAAADLRMGVTSLPTAAFQIANDQIMTVLVSADPQSELSTVINDLKGEFRRSFEEAGRAEGIRDPWGTVRKANCALGARWGAAGIRYQDLLKDPTVDLASSQTERVDKLSLHRAGLRLRELLLRTEAECVLGGGLRANVNDHKVGNEVGDRMFDGAPLQIESGAIPLIGSFASAREHSGSIATLDQRPSRVVF